MVIKEIKIPYEYRDKKRFFTLSDWHVGAKACDLGKIKKYLDKVLPEDYIIGIGDLFDCITATDKRYAISEQKHAVINNIDEQYKVVRELLAPYKDQILGLGVGNHEYKLLKKNGVDLIGRLCDDLCVDHLGYASILKLVFRENGGRGRTVLIHVHHGHGGGATRGSDLTRYERDMNYIDADIYLRGHTHKFQIDTIPRVALIGKKLTTKPRYVMVCGTFLRTYSDSRYPTYSEMAGYPPSMLKNMVFEIMPDRDWVKIYQITNFS